MVKSLLLSAPCFLFVSPFPSLCVFRAGGGENFYCLIDYQFPFPSLSSPGVASKSPYVSQGLAEVSKEKIMCVCIYIFSMCDKYHLEN